MLEGRNQIVDLNDFHVQILPAREGQQLLIQLGAAAHGLPGRIEQPANPWFVRHAAAQHVETAADDHQKVVEVVRDAAGQLADGLHLLGLPQLLVDLAPLRHVGGDAGDPDRLRPS